MDTFDPMAEMDDTTQLINIVGQRLDAALEDLHRRIDFIDSDMQDLRNNLEDLLVLLNAEGILSDE